MLVTEYTAGDSDRPYILLGLEKKGFSTFDAMKTAESWFGISQMEGAGLKDSDGITSQKVSIPVQYRDNLKRIDAFNLEHTEADRFIHLTFLGYIKEPLKPARLEGNVFRLRLRGLDRAKAES